MKFAPSLFVGFNTLTPIQVYDTNGKYMQDFGPSGAVAAFPDGTSSYISISPSSNLTTSVVTRYNSSLSAIGNFTVGNLVTDGGVIGGDLLFSAYDGTVYRTASNGTLLNSWSTGFSHVGVTSDGTDVFTTEGGGGNLIDVWNAAGVSVRHIATPFSGLYGLGYDAATGNFWAGSTNYVYELSPTGSLLSTLNLVGDSRTPNGALHDGLETGDFLPPVTTPEPSAYLLLLTGALLLFAFRGRLFAYRSLAKICVVTVGAASASFGSVNVTLSPSTSNAPVGTTIVWTARASDSTKANATFTYQFSVGPSRGSLQVRQDFYTFNSYAWTPSDEEGVYDVQVVVHSSTGSTGIASAAYDVQSRISGASPVVSRTNHPLVALYSMPPCAAGRTARVRFKLPSDTVWQTTSVKNCTGSTSLNFYIAGMLGSTTYQLQQDVFNGPFATPGPVINFATGAIPSHLPIQAYSLVKASPAPNNTAYPVLLSGPTGSIPYATDTMGRMIWYLPPQLVVVDYLTRPLAGGTLFALTLDGSSSRASRLLREYDLAGNVVRETNYAAISAQLSARGADPVTTIHHDAIRLPNGWTALLGSVEKVADQGAGPVDVLGDQIVVLDENFQLKWWWNEFDHLDIMRPAVLGELCHRTDLGCPVLTNPAYSVANDWTHSNALAYAPDGNLIVSSRHQDWVMKVDYANGTGDGKLLWRLGKDGDFQVSSSAANPWFSHQHNAEFQANGELSLFDNGNTRIAEFGGHSRGQAWRLDETNKVATPVVNLDLGEFSTATGSAQLLSNGNYTFDLGFLGKTSKTKEFSPSNALESQQDSAQNSYRSFRMRSLYSEY